jgi:hypothetical protein
MTMQNGRLCTTIVIVVAALACAPAMARGIHAGSSGAAQSADTADQCAEKLRGNSDWASVILNSGGGWPLYAFASNDYPYYARGYCNYGPAPGDSYGYAPAPKGTQHRK